VPNKSRTAMNGAARWTLSKLVEFPRTKPALGGPARSARALAGPSAAISSGHLKGTDDIPRRRKEPLEFRTHSDTPRVKLEKMSSWIPSILGPGKRLLKGNSPRVEELQ